MQQTTGIKIKLELISWVLTAIISFMVLYPTLNVFHSNTFVLYNLAFVVVFITYTRYIFLLKHSLFSHNLPIKILIIFTAPAIIFTFMNWMYEFQDFLDTEGLFSFDLHFRPEITEDQRETIISYMRREMIFFGTAAIIATVLIPFRMLISAWRVYNKTGKV